MRQTKRQNVICIQRHSNQVMCEESQKISQIKQAKNYMICGQLYTTLNFLSFCTSLCLSLCPPICLYICLSLCLSLCLPICLCNCLSLCLPICLCNCLSLCLSYCLSLCLSFVFCLSFFCLCLCLSLCLPICLCICLSVCLLIFLMLKKLVDVNILWLLILIFLTLMNGLWNGGRI